MAVGPKWNMIIGTPNWYDRVQWSAGSAAPDYPAASLAALPLSYLWRSGADTTATHLAGVLDKPRRVRLVALVNHNLSPTARVRVRFYGDVAGSLLQWDSGAAEAWPPVCRTRDLDWNDPNWWSGRYDTEEIVAMIGATVVRADREYVPALVRIDLADPANPEGFLQAGFVDLAGELQLPVNFGVGARAGHDVLDDVSRSRSGVLQGVAGARLRSFRGQIQYGERAGLRAGLGEFLRRHGKTRPFFVIPEPGNLLELPRTSFLAVNDEVGLGE